MHAKSALPPRTFASSLLAGLLLASAVAAPAVARAKTVLVIGAHPDDEVLLSAGRTRTAFANGDIVKVVVVTNGDVAGVADGLQREGQSVQSALTLGLTEQDVIFLGYPDGSLRDIYFNSSPTAVITSAAGQTETYGNRGLGGMEYHRYLYGVHGPYNRQTAMGDFQALIQNYMPDEIYTHNEYEWHGDHEATAFFLMEALRTLQNAGLNLHTKLYQSIVWMPGSTPWPQIDPSGWTPLVPFLMTPPCNPGECMDMMQLDWSRAYRFAQPPEMLRTDQGSNMKALAIPIYSTWFTSFVRLNEFFWLKDYGTNVAITAQVTASSEVLNGAAVKAVDGAIKGAPLDRNVEWISNETAGAWIQLSWPTPMRIAQVNLWDRPSTTDNVLASRLTFSDGSSIDVGQLPPSGKVSVVTFAPKVVSWVRFTIDQGEGAVGLSEIQVFGQPASSSANLPPHFLWGPVPANETIPASQSTTLAVLAYDLDGDTLQYVWSADAGLVQGSGTMATFTPPPVSSDTWVPISVQALDGRGGSVTNRTYVHVTPAVADSVAVAPALLFGGGAAQGTLALGSPAGAGGVVVPLASSNSAAATVPASVTIPAGASIATFTISTHAVSASTQVVITASFPAGPRTAGLTVAAPSVSGLSVSPTSVLGGSPAQGTVTLPAPAGPSDVVVSLASAAPAVASVPATVVVPAGATSATFAVSTAPVAAPTNVTLSASWGTTSTAVLTVSPLVVSAVSFAPVTVVGGSAALGTVTLNGSAPAGGAVVGLSSSAPAVAAVPATVTVAAGAQSATFQVTTSQVSAQTSVMVTATYLASSASAALSVVTNANPNLLTDPEQIGSAAWQVWGDMTATLNFALAPDGTQHATRAVSTGWGHAVRQAVTVTPGTTYTFSFFARNNGGPAASLCVYDDSHGVDIIAPTSYLAQIGSSSFTRIGVTFTVPAGVTRVAVYPLRDSGGAVNILLWGAKLEVGSAMTGYEGLGTGSGSLTFSPSSVTGGGTAQGTVTLGAPAPSGGTVVSLSSSAPAVAAVPPSVTVPAGLTQATFTVTTAAVTSTTTVTISAALPSGTASATITVTPAPPTLTGLTVSPASVVGGTSSTGTVTLSAVAGSGGATVSLTSSAPSVASVPASVTVPAGASSASFTAATTAVATATPVTLSAALGTSNASGTLTVVPASVGSVALSPASVTGGASVTGTVTLTGPAPSGGAAVALTSSDPSATVPASVTVAAGATTATFGVTTAPVAATTTATVSASWGGGTATASVTVVPPVASSLTLNPASVVGGATSTGTVVLSGAAPAGGALVALSSGNTVVATVPASVTVPAGSTSTTFIVSTSPVAASATAIISATLGATASATITVTPAPPTLTGLTVSPASVVGGTSSTGTVTLSAVAGSGGATVSLTSSAPSVASVPASVTVPAGASSASFTAATTAVATATPVTLSAALGTSNASGTLTVVPASVGSVALSPASVTGGASVTGTVTLTGPAPSGGAAVALTSSDPSATVPASVTVAAGATTATFGVTTAPVAATTTATVSASWGGGTATASVTVVPPVASSLTLNPASVVGGATSTGTVVLSGAAPAGGALVALSSGNTVVATVPASVTVPAGSTSTTFIVSTSPVAASATAIISATLGATASATITVTPAPTTITGLSFSPTNPVGGTSSTGTVTLGAAAPAGGAVVALSSNNVAATVPGSVSVAAGSLTATFTVTTSPVASNTSVTITARMGTSTRNATLTVRAPAPASVTLNPTVVAGGGTSTGTVTLTGPAAPSGIVVALASNRTAAIVPASVTVPEGATSATFPIETTPVTSNTNASISATFNGTTRSATLSVRLLAPSTLTLAPTTVTGGTGATGTVTLNAAALDGGFTVALSAGNTTATVPPSVVVPAGSTSATFPIQTIAVTAQRNVAISASANGVTRRATLTVTP